MSQVQKIYKHLFQYFGPQQWWPGETPFEIIVGAILTQNTNWQNVEKAIVNLKAKKALKPKILRGISHQKLAQLIRPAGYFNVKADRLKMFLHFLFTRYGGSLKRMEKTPLPLLREELLGVKGIGPETADSILLYAFDRPVFVIDAYTKRIFFRYGLIAPDAGYTQMQQFFMKHLQEDVPLYNEYHALIVSLGKDFCKPKPKCAGCPLSVQCRFFKNN